MIISITESEIYQDKIHQEKQQFYKENWDLPAPEDLECLDIILKDKAEAVRIIRGEQTAVIVRCTPFYDQYVLNKNVVSWTNTNIKRGRDANYLWDNVQPLRFVESLHLHDWADTWYLDIEVVCNDWFTVTKENLDEMQKVCKYDFSEFYEELEAIDIIEDTPELHVLFAKADETTRPAYYYFLLGADYKTNIMCGRPLSSI